MLVETHKGMVRSSPFQPNLWHTISLAL